MDAIINHQSNVLPGLLNIYSLNEEGQNLLFDDYIHLNFEKYIFKKIKGKPELDYSYENVDFDFASNTTLLLGDWVQKKNGKFIPDLTENFAAVFNTKEPVIKVIYSKIVQPCHACFFNSILYGDLANKEQKTTLAYTLSSKFLLK